MVGAQDKIQFFTSATPNGRKVAIFLEESGIPFEEIHVDLAKGEQRTEKFLRINPNGKIPAIVDPNGPMNQKVSVFESGAILLYLAEKTGKFLAPLGSPERHQAQQWLMWQMAAIGPNFGNYYQFAHRIAPKNGAAIERFETESQRLMKVMEARLSETEFLAGEYSIADMATIPWMVAIEKMAPQWLESKPCVKRWISTLVSRSAVQRGLKI